MSRRRDKWRRKTWFTVISPPYLGMAEIGETVANNPSNVLGRVLETTLFDITGEPPHKYINLYFQVAKVDGTKAYTIFKGHEYIRDFLRSLIRRRSTRVDCICDVETKDGYQLRVSAIALTTHKIQSSQASAIRKLMQSIIEEKAKKAMFADFVNDVVFGKLDSEIFDKAKKIAPLRHVGVFKSKLLKMLVAE
jgi:small subunit ribosomal protein S3Ae